MARPERPVDPEVQADLDAVDAALRGESLPESDEGLDDLVAAIQGNKPTPEPDYARSLDSWIEGGLKPDARPGLGRSELPPARSGLLGRLGFGGSRPWLPVAAGAATVLIVISVAVSQTDGGGDEALPEVGAGQSIPEDNALQEDAPIAGDSGVAAPSAAPEAAAGASGADPVVLGAFVPARATNQLLTEAVDVAEGLGGRLITRGVSDEATSEGVTAGITVPGPRVDELVSDLVALGFTPVDAKGRRSGSVDIATVQLEIAAE